MMFDPRPFLKGATSRGKSDVANKLVSMLLHEISKKVCKQADFSVANSEYGDLVFEHFGSACPYCLRELKRPIAVEHLEGMNRMRAGLHIPGNVLVACHDCNREKRRDDQMKIQILADSGWESFLSHDSSRCSKGCKTCDYWKSVIENDGDRTKHLQEVRMRIHNFQRLPKIMKVSVVAQPLQLAARQLLAEFYRLGQEHAQTEIAKMAAEIEATAEASLQPL